MAASKTSRARRSATTDAAIKKIMLDAEAFGAIAFDAEEDLGADSSYLEEGEEVPPYIGINLLVNPSPDGFMSHDPRRDGFKVLDSIWGVEEGHSLKYRHYHEGIKIDLVRSNLPAVKSALARAVAARRKAGYRVVAPKAARGAAARRKRAARASR